MMDAMAEEVLRDKAGDDPGVAFRADPSLPGVEDPYPLYAALREQAPAHWCDGPQMWAILAYPEAREALREPTLLRQPERDNLAELYGQSDIYERQKLDLPYMDGEAHRVMRRHVINAYRAIDVAQLAAFIRRFADERLASVAGQDSFDLMAVLAADLPVYVVSHLLGEPPQQHASVAAVVRPFVAARGLIQDAAIAAGGDSAVAVFEEFFVPFIHARRVAPTGDLTSRLIADPIDGMTMSDGQMLLLVSSNFYAASLFTIRLLIGTMAMAMAKCSFRKAEAPVSGGFSISEQGGKTVLTLSGDFKTNDMAPDLWVAFSPSATPLAMSKAPAFPLKPGSYTLTYNATDVAGHAATPVSRTVTVSIADANTIGADGFSPLMRYAFGASGPNDPIQVPFASFGPSVKPAPCRITVTPLITTGLAMR
jgi:hypothetical protein